MAFALVFLVISHPSKSYLRFWDCALGIDAVSFLWVDWAKLKETHQKI